MEPIGDDGGSRIAKAFIEPQKVWLPFVRLYETFPTGCIIDAYFPYLVAGIHSSCAMDAS